MLVSLLSSGRVPYRLVVDRNQPGSPWVPVVSRLGTAVGPRRGPTARLEPPRSYSGNMDFDNAQVESPVSFMANWRSWVAELPAFEAGSRGSRE